MISETNGEKQRIKWTMTNVKRGEQPDALFELPPGAKPMGGMAGLSNMMGGMPGMGGAGTCRSDGDHSCRPRHTGCGQRACTTHCAPANQSPDQNRDPSLPEEVATEAAETAKQTTKDETNNAVREGVRDGIRSLFGR